MNIVLSLVIAYLLGSIPFAYLISRMRGVDIREVGDRNVGSFNVFRHAGLGAGLATMLLDIGKGMLAIVVAKALHVSELVVFLAGVVAVAGHNWPVFLCLRGGRGVGTIVGAVHPLAIHLVAFLFPARWAAVIYSDLYCVSTVPFWLHALVDHAPPIA